MRTTHCKLSALLVLSLVPYTAVAQADESIKRQQVCQVGDGETCKDSINWLDEGLSLIQHQMSDSERTSSNSGDVSSLVQAAISMYKANGGRVTPEVQAFLTTVRTELDDTVFPSITAAHGVNQARLGELHGDIKGTLTKLASDKQANTGMEGQVATKRAALKTCREGESRIHSLLHTCMTQQAAAQGTFDSKKAALTGVLVQLKDHFANVAMVLAPSDPEKQKELMLKAGFRRTLVTHGVESFVNPKNPEYDDAKGTLERKKAECEGIANDLRAKRASCDSDQGTFERSSCQYAVSMKKMCTVFARTYSAAVAAYEQEEDSVEKLEADRVEEFTGLTHAGCILDAIAGTGGLSKEKIQACQTVLVDTTALKIDYKPTPPDPGCPSVPPYPCNNDFMSNEYVGKMPSGTRAATCSKCDI